MTTWKTFGTAKYVEKGRQIAKYLLNWRKVSRISNWTVLNYSYRQVWLIWKLGERVATLTALTELTWWHRSHAFSQGVPAPLSVVCYPLRVGRKQDWNKILTKTFLTRCCLPVFVKICLCFLVGPHGPGSCQATSHVSYAFTIIPIHLYLLY